MLSISNSDLLFIVSLRCLCVFSKRQLLLENVFRIRYQRAVIGLQLRGKNFFYVEVSKFVFFCEEGISAPAETSPQVSLRLKRERLELPSSSLYVVSKRPLNSLECINFDKCGTFLCTPSKRNASTTYQTIDCFMADVNIIVSPKIRA